jgi:hypothetical protein
VVKPVAWRPAYRIIDSRHPFVGIYDRVADPVQLAQFAEVEALTNERLLDELGILALVRPSDRVSGPGTTPIMAAFTHARASRFSNGTFGVYYAAKRRDTAVAEVRHHKERFLRESGEASIDLDMRVYAADIHGRFEDVRTREMSDAIYQPDSYEASKRFGLGVYEANVADGIAYRSVRDHSRAADCVAVFRPRCITNCVPVAYLGFRWNGSAITESFVKEEIIRFSE